MGIGNQDETAFAFEGNWRDYAPIAFTNLLLTIVTLGFYRFWATTRTRKYLWSQTRFIDEHLEWTGTGKELFVGFLIVVGLVFLPLLFFQFGFQALLLQGYTVLASIIGVTLYLGLLYLGGLALFRALRYRLSRTYWHGIRGGTDDQGFGYGWAYIWRTFVGFIAFGLMVPWSMTKLWNKRWGAMSFGPHPFVAKADWSKIIGRYLLCYLAPFVAIIAVAAVMVPMVMMRGAGGAGAVAAFSVLAVYFILPLFAIAYYAAFFRQALGTLSLSTLNFAFTARTKDWLLFYLGSIGLVIITLGIGAIFQSYRNWRFFITHLEASGEVNLTELTQSETRMATQGEGLLDAFDVGAF